MFYEKLKEARLNKGYSQMKLARLLGVNRATYLVWEYGAGMPKPQNMEKLLEVLPELKNGKTCEG